jgi:homoprotocatechuate degradation regulator HpaR
MTRGKGRLPPYRQSLAGTLLRAREAVMAPIRAVLRAANLTDQQWRILRVLGDEGPWEPSGLGTASILHAPSVTRILRELAERGLIVREKHGQDGRRSIITISSEGRALVESVSSRTIEILADYQHRFGTERLKALQQELIALAHAIGDARSLEDSADTATDD